MSKRWTFAALLAAALASAPAVDAAETVVACDVFKSAWNAAIRAGEPGRADLAYDEAADRDGGARIGNLAGMQGRLVCREGALGRLELRQDPGDPADTRRRLLEAAASVLVAFDAGLSANAAADLVAAMRAEAGPSRDAVSAWGPYEITYGRGAAPSGDSFVVDLAEN